VPFDPAKVEQFDVNSSVPTLNMVIGDISKGQQSLPCLEAPIAVFKKFLEKVRAENTKGGSSGAGADQSAIDF
jgi:hypothetical protein